jgi:hypothetical protein
MLKTQTTLEIFHKQRTESEYCFLSQLQKKKKNNIHTCFISNLKTQTMTFQSLDTQGL